MNNGETKPLNPVLHKRLQDLFGKVKVRQAGEAMSASAGKDPATGRPRLIIQHPGEYYDVCCPFCGDRRYRLSVNYKYLQRGADGRKYWFLAYCFNEDCLNKGYDDDLKEMVTSRGMISHMPLRKGQEVDLADRVAMPPGVCRRLDTLPYDHPANVYLRGRQYDPVRLAKAYGVSYCENSTYYHARRRIVAPVVFGGKLRGWQARYIGELPWKDPARKADLPPKYYTDPAMEKSKVLYNFDTASKFRTGVVVEGFADVWGFGPMAIGTFGSSMSDAQAKLIAGRWNRPGRSVVLLWDPDTWEIGKNQTEPSIDRALAKLRPLMDSSRFAAIRLPAGVDPGTFGRKPMREFVEDEAAAQGVEVTWETIQTLTEDDQCKCP